MAEKIGLTKEDLAPMRPATLIDRLFQLRAKRYDVQHRVDAMKQDESLLKMELVERLKENGSEGVVGRLARCELRTKEIVRVEDWDEFHKWVRRNNRFDLLQKRVNERGIKEIWEAKKKVRGATKDQITDLSIGKK